jgi:hypothetical protein
MLMMRPQPSIFMKGRFNPVWLRIDLGPKALEESVARADELAAAGDDDGAATWRRIMAAVTEFANETPTGPLH